MKFPLLWSGLCCCTKGWGGKCSEILATMKLLWKSEGKESIHFTSHFTFLSAFIFRSRNFCAFQNLKQRTDGERVSFVFFINFVQLTSSVPFHSEYLCSLSRLLTYFLHWRYIINCNPVFWLELTEIIVANCARNISFENDLLRHVNYGRVHQAFILWRFV